MLLLLLLIERLFWTLLAEQNVIFLEIAEKMIMSWLHRDVPDRPAQDDLVVIVQVVLHGYDVLVVVGAETKCDP